jgi:hypothetical protein
MDRDEKILDYIDGLLSAEEAEQVREKIATDGEWKTRYDSFLEMNTLLRSTELLSPSASFVDQTMARIEAEIEVESKSVSPILRFFQLTGWLWLGLTMLFFADFNTSVFSHIVQQGVSDFTIMTKSGTHLLFGNSAMLWAFGVLLMAYVAVRNYDEDNGLFKEMLN